LPIGAMRARSGRSWPAGRRTWPGDADPSLHPHVIPSAARNLRDEHRNTEARGDSSVRPRLAPAPLLPRNDHQRGRMDLDRAVEKFLYREARLMDEQRYDEWLDLWTEDALYFVPCNDEEIDPKRHVTLIYDDRTRLEDRIEEAQRGAGYERETKNRHHHGRPGRDRPRVHRQVPGGRGRLRDVHSHRYRQRHSHGERGRAGEQPPGRAQDRQPR